MKRLVSIRWQDWCFVCVLVLLNLLRKTIRLEYHHCNSYDFKCSEENDHYLFLFTGMFVLFLVVYHIHKCHLFIFFIITINTSDHINITVVTTSFITTTTTTPTLLLLLLLLLILLLPTLLLLQVFVS